MSTTLVHPTDCPPALSDDGPLARLVTQDGEVHCVLERPVTLAGSRRDCHLSLVHPDVSKLHCAIVRTGRAVIARDLRSRDGTFVNGQRTAHAVLHAGDCLRIGPYELTLELEGADESVSAEEAFSLEAPLTLRSEQRVLQLTHQPVLVGQRKTCDVVVDEASVSLAHAIIYTLGGRPAVHDLGSRSGTYVNDERVEDAWLDPGAALRIGTQRFTVDGASYDALDAQSVDEIEFVAVAEPDLLPENLVSEASMSVADSGINAIEASIVRLRTHVSATRSNLERQSAVLSQREEMLRQREGQYRDMLREMEAAERELEERAASAEQRRAELDQHEQLLADRERALAEREATEAHAQKKMAHLRSTLREMTEAFSVLSPEAAAAAGQDEDPEAMPAPLVDEPMFTPQVDHAAPPPKAGPLPRRSFVGRSSA